MENTPVRGIGQQATRHQRRYSSIKNENRDDGKQNQKKDESTTQKNAEEDRGRNHLPRLGPQRQKNNQGNRQKRRKMKSQEK